MLAEFHVAQVEDPLADEAVTVQVDQAAGVVEELLAELDCQGTQDEAVAEDEVLAELDSHGAHEADDLVLLAPLFSSQLPQLTEELELEELAGAAHGSQWPAEEVEVALALELDSHPCHPEAEAVEEVLVELFFVLELELDSQPCQAEEVELVVEELLELPSQVFQVEEDEDGVVMTLVTTL